MIEFLIAGMLAWMSVNCAVVDEIHPEHNPCQYNYDVTHPKVALLSQKDLKYEFYSRGGKSVGSNEKVDLYGFYIVGRKTIYLEDLWSSNVTNDKSTLFHELYHHVEFENNRIDRCISHREIPIAMFQNKYVKSLGKRQYMPMEHYDAPCNVYYKGIR